VSELQKKEKAEVLSWYGHVERMEEERVVKRVYRSKVEGNRGRGRLKLRWVDGVKAVA
jgi:trehalose utilization protein